MYKPKKKEENNKEENIKGIGKKKYTLISSLLRLGKWVWYFGGSMELLITWSSSITKLFWSLRTLKCFLWFQQSISYIIRWKQMVCEWPPEEVRNILHLAGKYESLIKIIGFFGNLLTWISWKYISFYIFHILLEIWRRYLKIKLGILCHGEEKEV